MKTLCTLAVILAGVLPAAAQRLPGNVAPVHYDLRSSRTSPRPRSPGREAIDVTLRRPRPRSSSMPRRSTFGAVQIAAAGRTQTAAVTLDAAKDQATFTVPADIPAGEARIQIAYAGHPQRRSARPVSEQGEQSPLRRHPARGDRRAPHVPVVRRAGVQGHVRAHRGHRRGRHAISNGAVVSDTPGPAARQAHGDVRRRRRRCRRIWWRWPSATSCATRASADGIPIRICSTPDKKALTGFALESHRADRQVLQPLLLDQIPVQEARRRRRA